MKAEKEEQAAVQCEQKHEQMTDEYDSDNDGDYEDDDNDP